MSQLHELLWQKLIDFWSLAHAWGWAAATYAVARTRGRQSVLLTAIIAGIVWEAVEYAWIEPWLHFHEPLGNRLCDVAFDALGAWIGAGLMSQKKSVDTRPPWLYQ